MQSTDGAPVLPQLALDLAEARQVQRRLPREAQHAGLLGGSAKCVRGVVETPLNPARCPRGALGRARGPTHRRSATALVGRYLDVFVRYDMEALVALLHEDATSLHAAVRDVAPGARPRSKKWMVGPGAPAAARSWMPGARPAASPAFAQWRPDGAGGYYPWSIQVVEIRDGRIAGLNYFLDVETLWPLFGLPQTPDPAWLTSA